ncbi:UNVERIFIED_CONTAM: hypothetical protein FKN15_034381 [Acipenser sinensis]
MSQRFTVTAFAGKNQEAWGLGGKKGEINQLFECDEPTAGSPDKCTSGTAQEPGKAYYCDEERRARADSGFICALFHVVLVRQILPFQNGMQTVKYLAKLTSCGEFESHSLSVNLLLKVQVQWPSLDRPSLMQRGASAVS